MKNINQKYLTGERALFQGEDLKICDTTFADGESPLKESRNIELYGSMFKWKYPLWYSRNIKLEDCVVFDMGRAGIWYTENISMKNCMIEAPKNFRRTNGIQLDRVTMTNAAETLWSCDRIRMNQVTAKGDYFAMNSSNIYIDGFELVGNYSFDGVKNVEIHHARMLSKDAFWNSENVTVYDSFISGEYLGWNARNLTLINCTIESNQGMCYIDNLVMKNCRLLNTTLAFEYSTVDAEVNNTIDSVLNPAGGRIQAEKIEELIMEASKVDVSKTVIQTAELKEAV
ncbi:DUF3737 family protein [Clostridium sp. AM58-1XD]|uniref:DUF3737 family protein n=1 Tax=Clostridium sp. AM58-1XD TaxID=2292307 RepID=UPI000E498A23|nr:DUF3737 family protein [Clostridium sp. AM58-1XD]RGY97937.1 DUF3737 family protein [Clostridium sp. AM58-1XD]